MRHKYDEKKIRRVIGEKVQFVQGDASAVYGALLAGCSFFAGYPITPASETAELMSKLLPKAGGVYIQMEDEIASMGAIIGASWAGAKTMTTTSGPGFSLMQENIGYACMTETPCVVIDVQRSGPSTGQPTEGSQGDMMQARWGTHGDHEIIALSPNSVQETLDLTIEAFNLSEKYRTPVILLTDGEIGHLREKCVMPEKGEFEIIDRKGPTVGRDKYVPFQADESLVPSMARFGDGYHVYVTGLTHVEKGYPSTSSAEDHDRLVRRLVDKIEKNRKSITMVEKDYQKGSKIAILAYGASARPSAAAVRKLRRKRKKVDFLRLITIWPFPNEEVRELADRVDRIYVPEMNLGQLVHPIREAAEGRAKIIQVPRIGGPLHTPKEIMDAMRKKA
ncbi:MAG: 2-oxoacid:acceptor oxidoreductase subunit alpha [Methanomassiliicoccales archaeon]|nr:MAG: 2-oxoacid:acceptor oxidoreductase subunit alpha [Methanomassiliicoccales archaeon]